MAKIRLTETVLRDAHQSLAATRMTTEEMLPVLEKLDKVGFFSLEAWGGATFDSCLRFLNEDPWQRLRTIREHVKDTKLQMLFRGQNILGYRHYADDVVEYFVQKSIANGIDVIRIFDALNDPRNLKTAISAAKREGGTVQAAISYTTGPVYNTKYFTEYAKTLADMGADIICIKDMAGLLLPYDAYELVSAIKKEVGLPIALHTHSTAGLAQMTTLKAVEAGIDIIDTALSPLSTGTSQPSTEPLIAALAGTEYDTGLDLAALDEITKYFDTVREKYLKSGLIDPKVLKVDINTLLYQVPGGMLSNLVSQLKQMGRPEKLPEVLAEIPNVRADAGYPPLVTPSSQIVGTQAVLNVLGGERYKTATKEFKAMVHGEYGATPMAMSDEFVKKITGSTDRITYRPADKLQPELDTLRKKIAPYYTCEEDVLTYALFEQVAEKFFEARKNREFGIDGNNSDKENKIHTV